MSISAFFTEDTLHHPHFNTVPDIFVEETKLHPYFNTVPDTFQTSFQSQHEHLPQDSATGSSNLIEQVQAAYAGPATAGGATTGHHGPDIDNNYSSVIIPNTIDDFLATHQVR